ncbi:hypothetical protein [Paenibacillus apiarius]|uniref:Uncharacterized protein n=1 Tax=Paenibacillus apiarius TaxID=46240 RepID=A0ABT4DWQ5_9BACL|nr:hypothetical protein [Paenibacillus apiarius]MBN3522909.1 hypothetical protein [Paenibacillus apiarius]MCY9515327.1 hypothetical protein [Paenibacillus apiarius]MCY9521783.1 hypothetical protein [Paenibacillus apiarius]MCY9550176.1 hypothetical protein [Paenibacillus apiarius]MCY9559452.1 hypothetical protein [Paenibacillus apiarius]
MNSKLDRLEQKLTLMQKNNKNQSEITELMRILHTLRTEKLEQAGTSNEDTVPDERPDTDKHL